METQVARALFQQAYNISLLMGSNFPGLRVFCLDADALALLNTQADQPWLSHAIIYLPEELFKPASYPKGIVTTKTSPSVILLLDKYWHAISFVAQEPGYCPLLSKARSELKFTPKVNLILGNPASAEYSSLSDLLQSQNCFPVASPTSSVGTHLEVAFPERSRRLKLLGDLVLNPAFKNIAPSFVGPLPKLNFEHPSRIISRGIAPAMPFLEVFKRSDAALASLKLNRVLFLCGFKSGCDFVAREACLRLASDSANKVLSVLQMSRQEATAYFQRYGDRRDEIYGRAFILRNFLDPDVYQWNSESSQFENVEDSFSEQSYQLFHAPESQIPTLINAALEERQGTFLVITTQYDSLEALITGIEGARSLQDAHKLALIKNVNLQSLAWLTAAIRDNDPSRHGYLSQAIALIEERRRRKDRIEDYPSWTTALPLLGSYAVIAENFRPSLWALILRELLDSRVKDEQEACDIAERLQEEALRCWRKLHPQRVIKITL